MKMKKIPLFALLFVIFFYSTQAQKKTNNLFPNHSGQFTHADTLRGSNTPERAWWDVSFYDLHVNIDIKNKSITGYNRIKYKVIKSMPEASDREMQIDLMKPLNIDSVIQNGQSLIFRRDGNAYFIKMNASQPIKSLEEITVYYSGHPHAAKNAPWDGGFVWETDSLNYPFVATATQGVGASLWWPNKDYQGDEPDSQRIAVTVPERLSDISNGRLIRKKWNGDGNSTYVWFVNNPINNYDVALNIGNYVHFKDTLQGEKGILSLNYYVLPKQFDTAFQQFKQAKTMLHCFEYWFGPYPWYKDGYKLVEAPFLGMEHQSNVAYGNKYTNGYLGRDLSHTGLGLKWDFIIIHESAHEWWGNNITTKDIADMWVHEAFANYAEALYTEWLFGRKAGDKYCRGTRENVLNDKPIIGYYGVNDEGSGDMYYKGGNMILCIREIINNDNKFRQILRGLNKTFRHQTVTGRQIQNYINEESGIDFTKVFQQYLTTTQIPHFEYKIKKGKLYYRWTNCVSGFDMAIKVTTENKNQFQLIHPTEKWQTTPLSVSQNNFKVSKNFYVKVVEK